MSGKSETFPKAVIKRTAQALGYEIKKIDNREDWPRPFCEKISHPFLILFTPQNSGSTAISKWLCSSNKIAPINDENCEGQWLVKGLRHAMWNPNAYVNYRSVAGIWQQEATRRKTYTPEIEFFIEKSPPNIIRAKQILEMFESRRAAINIRNPYANISSQIKRYGKKNFPTESREDVTAYYSDFWCSTARLLRQTATKYQLPVLKYEDFCENPSTALKVFDLEEKTYHEAAPIKVKDYPEQRVENMNQYQIDYLSKEQIEIISEKLQNAREEMNFFGYEIL